MSAPQEKQKQQIMCWVDSEDYWNLNAMNKDNQKVDYYGYTFEVEGGTEGIGSSIVRLVVVELISAKIAVGFILPNHINLGPEFQLRFICHDSPTDDIAVDCKLSDEVKNAKYMGDDNEKIEYIGFTLEKFYENNSAKFYLHDLRPQDAKGEPGSQP